MQIDPSVERDEIRFVVCDEDDLFIDDQLVQGLVGQAEQIAVAVAGRPVAAAIGSLNEGG